MKRGAGQENKEGKMNEGTVSSEVNVPTRSPGESNVGRGGQPPAKTLEERVTELEEKKCEKKWLELPVAEVETVVTCDNTGTIRFRLKGQRPDSKCLLELSTDKELIESIHEAKKRGGTVWVRFSINKSTSECGKDKDGKSLCKPTFCLTNPELVVRDILE